VTGYGLLFAELLTESHSRNHSVQRFAFATPRHADLVPSPHGSGAIALAIPDIYLKFAGHGGVGRISCHDESEVWLLKWKILH
jgi:hypothetical protein